MSNLIKISYFGKHFGEEPPLVGDKKQGAGGVFFSGCNLRCVFCQNYQISQDGFGKFFTIEELAGIMLKLEQLGAVNIDLVSPAIWWQQIREALIIAKNKGLKIPIIWNSNGYEEAAIIKALAGIVDIYLPDFKYGIDEAGEKYSGVKDYSKKARLAINEMFDQVGVLVVNENGVAQSGLIIRHLILPGQIENSRRALGMIADVNKNIPVSLMRQYYPLHQAGKFPEINRVITEVEFQQVFDFMIELGLENGFVQQENSEKIFIPDFRKNNPFDNN